MGKVYRALMSRIPSPVRAVFLDTPAGFELNVDQISARAVQYFEQSLQVELDVASFKSAASATPDEITSALMKLRMANLIVAGPGSPTYAVRNWRDTVIFEALARRLASGAHLVLASAAAIAIGSYALPVYEIYKVGEPPKWKEGLDLLRAYGLDLAIIPHWNNSEGGTHDTRCCYVGMPRLRHLEQQLPASTTILGIDEYTACILDLGERSAQVMGAGQVTTRCAESKAFYPSGTTFQLDKLMTAPTATESAGERAPLQSPPGAEKRSVALPPKWDSLPASQATDVAELTSLIELLVQVRSRLRETEQWALADEIRDRLAELGVALEDGPAETSWRWD